MRGRRLRRLVALAEAERPLTIALFGVASSERRVLEDALGNMDRYSVVLEEDSTLPDVCIVDKRNIGALTRARLLARRLGDRPVITITRAGDTQDRWYLPRPLSAARALTTIARVHLELRGARRLPIAKRPTPLRAISAPRVHPRAEITSPKAELRALVVDNTALGKHQVLDALQRCGVSSDIATSGEEAAGMVASRSYDLLFFDAALSGTDGYRICREMAEAHRQRQVPVFMLTGRRKGYDIMRGKLWGCAAALSKPLQLAEFRRVLADLSTGTDSGAMPAI